MTYHIIVQYATDKSMAPKASQLRRFARETLRPRMAAAEVTLRIVGIEEMSRLNATYRQKKGPTNVLSFPCDLPDAVALETPLLGDIVICAQVVNREALEQHKSLEAHWAHMVVHGIMHLLGYDHETDDDARVMENLETIVMQALNFANPYDIGDDNNHYE